MNTEAKFATIALNLTNKLLTAYEPGTPKISMKGNIMLLTFPGWNYTRRTTSTLDVKIDFFSGMVEFHEESNDEDHDEFHFIYAPSNYHHAEEVLSMYDWFTELSTEQIRLNKLKYSEYYV